MGNISFPPLEKFPTLLCCSAVGVRHCFHHERREAAELQGSMPC